jgi:predicted O-linked N-acetylglucosamine transferase (SPINDLY family)
MDPRLIDANAALGRGAYAEATDLIIAALEGGAPPSDQIYHVLLKHLLTLRRYPALLAWASKAVAFNPRELTYGNYLGVVLRRTGRYPEALAALERNLTIAPEHIPTLINKGNVLNDMQDGPAAEAVFAALVRRAPRSAALQRSLGRALWTQNKLDAAAVRVRQAIALQKDDPELWLDLAAILAASGKSEASLKLLDKAIEAFPNEPSVLKRKATSLRNMGKAVEAGHFLEAMKDRLSNAAWYHHEYGRLLSDKDRLRANGHFRKAVELEPDDVDNRLALLESLDRTRAGDEGANSEEAYQLAKKTILPGQPAANHRKILTEILTRAGDYEAAATVGGFTELGRAWAMNGVNTALLGHMARVHSDDDRRELLYQHRLWGNSSIERAQLNPIRHPSHKCGAKTRLGFMSSDLRNHPVAAFAWPIFEHADRDRFEIYCYSFYRGTEADRTQQYFASRVDAFRWNPHIGDRDAAQMIADDDLDILFELGGSTHMNKIEVMAWKPARLCASWMGYPHSAGLSTIDYLMVDPFLNPPEPDLLIEKPLIMPHCWIAMSEQAYPDGHQILPLAPVKRNGFVTFGTANNPYKYNPQSLAAWARILARVPDSRFLFVRPEGGAKSFVANIRAHFEAEGVSGDRIEFRPIRGMHMPHYNDIDITLDTFPQTGGTTTCDALWMGVPTVTLVGKAIFERMSLSILSNVGLADLCADTVDAYVDIAARLAANADRLQDLRTGLRDRIKASPLGQTRQFTRDFYDLVADTVRNAAAA